MVDLQWRLVHGGIATNRHVALLNPAVGKGCLLSLGTAGAVCVTGALKLLAGTVWKVLSQLFH